MPETVTREGPRARGEGGHRGRNRRGEGRARACEITSAIVPRTMHARATRARSGVALDARDEPSDEDEPTLVAENIGSNPLSVVMWYRVPRPRAAHTGPARDEEARVAPTRGADRDANMPPKK